MCNDECLVKICGVSRNHFIEALYCPFIVSRMLWCMSLKTFVRREIQCTPGRGTAQCIVDKGSSY